MLFMVYNRQNQVGTMDILPPYTAASTGWTVRAFINERALTFRYLVQLASELYRGRISHRWRGSQRPSSTTDAPCWAAAADSAGTGFSSRRRKPVLTLSLRMSVGSSPVGWKLFGCWKGSDTAGLKPRPTSGAPITLLGFKTRYTPNCDYASQPKFTQGVTKWAWQLLAGTPWTVHY